MLSTQEMAVQVSKLLPVESRRNEFIYPDHIFGSSSLSASAEELARRKR